MTNKATKYGLMTIAAVLLVALVFAGAGAANGESYTAKQWNALDDDAMKALSGIVYIADSNSNEVIYPKYNNTSVYPYGFLLGDNLTLDFIDYHGKFYGDPNANSGNKGALFGYVNLSEVTTQRTLTIRNIDLDGVAVTPTSGSQIGGIVGLFEGNSTVNSTINLTNCTVKNCLIGNMSVEIKYLGSLVGYVYRATANVDTCTAENCEVVSKQQSVGGLVGRASSAYFVKCDVRNCVMASVSHSVGGVIGGGTVSFVECDVVNCSISGSHQIGGFIGNAYDLRSYTTMSLCRCMRDCNVSNCIICGGSSGRVGALIGKGYACVNGIEGCNISHTVVSGGINGGGSGRTGGFVGLSEATDTNCSFVSMNWLNCCAVRGDNAVNVGKIVGYDENVSRKLDEDVNVTQNSVWLATQTSSMTSYPRIIVAKSSDPESRGPETDSLFNMGMFGDPVGLNAKNVTHITGYGIDGKYEVLAYVYETAPEYLIRNTSVINGIVFAENATNPAGCITQAAYGELIHVVAVNNTAGYHFGSWNVTNSTGQITVTEDNFTMPASPVNIGANFIPNTSNVIASDNKAEFGNDNVTAIHSRLGTVTKVLLENVSNVANSAVNFTADNTSVHIPSSVCGYNKEEISVFEINATADGTAKINVTITFKDAATVATEKDNVSFFHYNVSAWEPLNCTIASQTGAEVLYTVETTSFSPFGIGLSSPITYTIRFDANGGQGSMADMAFTYDVGQNLTANAFQRYNSNFLYWTYNGTKYYNTEFVKNLTVNQSEIVVMKAQWEGYSTGGSSSGSTYMGSSSASYTPTQQPTVAPTVAPTAKPTEQPATPTVIATEKPTTQPTQQSPAPFVGILAGLGAAAVLLRLKK